MSLIFGQLDGDMSTAYCASKGAVRLLTKALAVDLGRPGTNIRVNSIHPGAIDTDLGRSGLNAVIRAGFARDRTTAEQMLVASAPIGRFGKVEDVAGVALFLASDASRSMTGAELTVDGGASII